MKANVPKTKTERVLSQLTPELQKVIDNYIQDTVRELSIKAIRKGAENIVDCCVMLSLQSLIDEFNFGTVEQKGRTMKINRFLTSFSEHAHDYSCEYDQAMAEALRLHLKQEGVTYEGI